MKNFIKSKWFMISLVTVIVFISAIIAINTGAAKDETSEHIEQQKVERVEEVKEEQEIKVNKPKPEVALEVQPTIEPQVMPEAAPEPPKTLSTQEYGNMYLDLSGRGQMCFEAIVARFPERFTEDVRENNIKALRVWSGPCATGIINPDPSDKVERGLIFAYGPNGAFFDSPLAKSQHLL